MTDPQSKSSSTNSIEVDGPVDDDKTLIAFDVPFAPEDPKKTLKLRQRLGLGPEERHADPNAVAVIDSFIRPRTWTEGGVRWVQKASPYPAPRIDAVRTKQRLAALVKEMGGRDTGVCPVRTYLHGECFIEVIRQVVAECWERGLLLLKVHAERVESQRAHRELFESRTGYAFRLALKGEKDTTAMVNRIERLKQMKIDLAKEELDLRDECKQLEVTYAEQLLIDEKRYNDELTALKKEANHKKNQLESLTAPIPKQ